MTDAEAYERANEAYKEAWQMALDLNQSAESRREWERKRDEAKAQRLELAYRLPNFSGLPARFYTPTVFV